MAAWGETSEEEEGSQEEAVAVALMAGDNQLWYLDSGCSRHMMEDKSKFLSLTAFEGGSVAFGNGKI